MSAKTEKPEQLDVVVVGGGAAGLNIAQLLGAYGHKVCLLDSKTDLLRLSFHTLGSFIDLKKFDLSDRVVASHITECAFYTKHVHPIKKVTASILNKRQLHAELLDKCRINGVEVRTSTRVVDSKRTGDHVEELIDEHGIMYRARIFIDASGVSGVLSKQIGLQQKTINIATGVEYNVQYLGPQFRSYIFLGKDFRGGYGWIFPLGSGRGILGFGTFHSETKAKLADALRKIAHLPVMHGLIKKDDDTLFGGTIPLTDVKKEFTLGNVVCLGDAVSQVNPIAGEGYRFVLDAGLIAVPFIHNALTGNMLEPLKNYERAWNEKYYRAYTKSKFLQKLAGKASANDYLADLIGVAAYFSSDKTFENILASRV